MMANITFLSFLLFSMCHSIHVAVNTWINCSFFTLIPHKSNLKVPNSVSSLHIHVSIKNAEAKSTVNTDTK